MPEKQDEFAYLKRKLEEERQDGDAFRNFLSELGRRLNAGTLSLSSLEGAHRLSIQFDTRAEAELVMGMLEQIVVPE